jgi:hypothetical protein
MARSSPLTGEHYEFAKRPASRFALSFFLFVYLTLARTEAGGTAGCHWAFPKWFGCVLWVHEMLAAGLIGAGGALIAAWIVWTAVQKQINAEQERMTTDRSEAERLLA